MPDLAIVACPDYDPERCRAALEELIQKTGGLNWLRRGMRVGIKANLVAPSKPEKAVATHPVLIKALADLIRERGAVPIVGDSPGGLFTEGYVNRVYHVTGMEETGVRLNDDYSVQEIAFPDAVAAKTFTVTGWLMKCDAVINFCKLKSHGMMGLSAAAKNLFGTIPGTLKPEYHFRFPDPADFGNMLVDLDEFWKPQLNLVDAVVAMEGNGPTAGKPKTLGCLLGGENPHKLDLICANLIGLDPAAVPTLQAAFSRGLTPENPDDLDVDGDWRAFRASDFEIITERNGLQFQNVFKGRAGEAFSRFLNRNFAARPGVTKSLCVGCEKCKEVCPAGAIRMQKKRPVIDRSKCIRCFCCQEFCPKGAMQVKRPPLARLLLRTK